MPHGVCFINRASNREREREENARMLRSGTVERGTTVESLKRGVRHGREKDGGKGGHGD